MRKVKIGNVRRSKRKKELVVGLMSVFVGVLVYFFLIRLEEKSLEAYQTKNVIIATKEIASGTQISLDKIDSYFKCIKVNGNNATDSFESIEELESWVKNRGCVLVCENIKSKEIIYQDKLMSVDDAALEYEKPLEVGLKVNSFEYCVGGTLRSGDVVDLCVLNNDINSEILLENVLILKAFDINGNEISPEDKKTVCIGFNIMMEQSDLEKYNMAFEQGTIKLTKKI